MLASVISYLVCSYISTYSFQALSALLPNLLQVTVSVELLAL